MVSGGSGGTAMLVPSPDEESEGFWQGTALGELRIQACGQCGRLRHPPRPMCPQCQSTERHWQRMSGRGTVWSFVVPHPPLLPAYEQFAPYNVIAVTLEEDPVIRLVGNLVAAPGGPINEVDPASITIGEPVRAVFSLRQAPDGSDMFLPEWVRAGG